MIVFKSSETTTAVLEMYSELSSLDTLESLIATVVGI